MLKLSYSMNKQLGNFPEMACSITFYVKVFPSESTVGLKCQFSLQYCMYHVYRAPNAQQQDCSIHKHTIGYIGWRKHLFEHVLDVNYTGMVQHFPQVEAADSYTRYHGYTLYNNNNNIV